MDGVGLVVHAAALKPVPVLKVREAASARPDWVCAQPVAAPLPKVEAFERIAARHRNGLNRARRRPLRLLKLVPVFKVGKSACTRTNRVAEVFREVRGRQFRQALRQHLERVNALPCHARRNTWGVVVTDEPSRTDRLTERQHRAAHSKPCIEGRQAASVTALHRVHQQRHGRVVVGQGCEVSRDLAVVRRKRLRSARE